MYKIKRLIIECKCGRKLFDENNVELSGDSLLVLVKPCECAAQQSELTLRTPDFTPRCSKCNAVAGWHYETCEDYSPKTQSH
jgi:hypothetical protein